MRYSEEEIKLIKQFARKHPRMKPIKVAMMLQNHLPERPLNGLAEQVHRYRAPEFLTRFNKWQK